MNLLHLRRFRLVFNSLTPTHPTIECMAHTAEDKVMFAGWVELGYIEIVETIVIESVPDRPVYTVKLTETGQTLMDFEKL